jgi:hypothetical protein
MTPERAVSLALNIQQTSDLTATKSSNGPRCIHTELKTYGCIRMLVVIKTVPSYGFKPAG